MAAAVGLLGGCATVDTGVAIRDPNQDPMAVNAALLDSGPFARKAPTSLGKAGDDGSLVESIRMSEYVILPYQADPALTRGSGAKLGKSGPVTSTDRLRDFVHSGDVASVVDMDLVVAGFGMYAESRDQASVNSANAVLRFKTPEDAQKAADDLLAAATADTKATNPRPAEIPGHPDTRAVVVDGDYNNTYLTALTTQGPLLLIQGIGGRDQGTIPVDSGIPLAGKLLDLQLAELGRYTPTPIDKLADQLWDPSTLLARTVPAHDRIGYRLKGRLGSYTAHGALAYEMDAGAMAQAFENAGVENVAVRRTRIIETRDAAAAVDLVETLSNQAAADKRTTSAGVNGFPSARCFEPIPDKMPWERPNYCVAPVDNYVIDIYSDEDLNITRQLLSAQYLLLTQE